MGRKLFLLQKMRSPKRGIESNWKGVNMFSVLMRMQIPSDTKTKGYQSPRKDTTMRFKLWMDFIEENGIDGYILGLRCATPDHTLIQEFLRWCCHLALGQKSKNGRSVMTSILNCAERLFFGWFEENMQIKIVMEDRREIFNENINRTGKNGLKCRGFRSRLHQEGFSPSGILDVASGSSSVHARVA
ncbi:hypothetical protein N7532_005957 [Penicillium argentinense]|uniref:Uncharacterized protein n=1 Tax=Penicillium argentinense TaxID=1131581 RepID=A0A9W9KAW8_9EURO|nr:uncharacterized protein N7532_005957 [Penicillium argentinense]KAJ5098956.1 hypothetical protein N7532_005957 [Penicillium argentinense]